MSKVTFEVEGIKITVEKEEDQGMFGRRGGYRQEDRYQYRGRFSDDYARRPYYQRDSEHDHVFPLYETRFAPTNVNQQYGKQSTGEPMFDESVLSGLRATANKAAEFADNVTGKPLNYEEAFERMYPQTACTAKAKDNKANHVGPYHKRGMRLDGMSADYDGLDDLTFHTKRHNQFMPAMVGMDAVEVYGIHELAESNAEFAELIAAYDKIKHAISTFIGKYIFSAEAIDLPFTQTDRGDYAVLMPVPYLSMDILLYVDMVEKEGKHYAISINFNYQSDVEGDDDETTPVEQSAKAFIVGSLRSYIKHQRSKRYKQTQADQSNNTQPEGQADGNEGNNQPVGETPVTQQKNQF